MNFTTRQGSFPVAIHFRGDLPLLLPGTRRPQPVARVLTEKTSIKDAIEACGVPHTEIDLITCDGIAVGFMHQLMRETNVEVYPVGDSPDAFVAARLQSRTIARFAADGHLGKLARDLRLLGFDVAYRSSIADEALIRCAIEEGRAILTRDRRLLMHAVVEHGYWLRSQMPEEQTLEVLRRFELGRELRPYSRCLRCNAEVTAVDKADVVAELEPLTKLYFDAFRRCSGCGAVYWPGSHFPKLEARVARIRSRFAPVSAARVAE